MDVFYLKHLGNYCWWRYWQLVSGIMIIRLTQANCCCNWLLELSLEKVSENNGQLRYRPPLQVSHASRLDQLIILIFNLHNPLHSSVHFQTGPGVCQFLNYCQTHPNWLPWVWTLLAQAACMRHACLRAPCVAWPLFSSLFSLSLLFFFFSSVFCF